MVLRVKKYQCGIKQFQYAHELSVKFEMIFLCFIPVENITGKR